MVDTQAKRTFNRIETKRRRQYLRRDTHGYNDQKIKDAERAKRLQELNIKLLRFTNVDVTESLEGVLQKIVSNHPLPPP